MSGEAKCGLCTHWKPVPPAPGRRFLTPAVAPRHLEDTVPSEIGRRTGQMLGNSICMRFPEQSGHGDRKENGGCRGQGEWGASV